MATQRVILAAIAGQSATALLARYSNVWLAGATRSSDPEDECVYHGEIDQFVESLRVTSHLPPVIYYTEWIDMWSMGDVLPGLRASSPVISGSRYQVCVHSPPLSPVKDEIAGSGETQESKWLRARIREAASAWKPLADRIAIVIAREPLGGLVTDEEMNDSFETVPEWLSGRGGND